MGSHPAAAADDEPLHKASRIEKTVVLLAVILPLAGTAYAVYRLWNLWITPLDLALLVSLYIATGVGIGVGFHRMLTHRSFESPAPVRLFYLILGSMALQGRADEWAATHLKHHAKSDRDGDPHSPLDGFWHAHVGWLFRDRFVVDGVYMKPFRDDKVVQFVSKTFFVWATLGFVLPGLVGLAIGGTWGAFWSGVLWGGLVRVFLGHHITWSVNSVCHTFGRREFESHDASRNEWIVGIFGFGEGWHNNHHAFPKAAYHGMKWYQFDFNAILIRIMKRLGLAKNVWMPKKAEMEARRVKKRAPSPPAPARAPDA